MKHQTLFSWKDTCKSKKLKCRLLQYSFGALRVKHVALQASPDQLRLDVQISVSVFIEK